MPRYFPPVILFFLASCLVKGSSLHSLKGQEHHALQVCNAALTTDILQLKQQLLQVLEKDEQKVR